MIQQFFSAQTKTVQKENERIQKISEKINKYTNTHKQAIESSHLSPVHVRISSLQMNPPSSAAAPISTNNNVNMTPKMMSPLDIKSLYLNEDDIQLPCPPLNSKCTVNMTPTIMKPVIIKSLYTLTTVDLPNPGHLPDLNITMKINSVNASSMCQLNNQPSLLAPVFNTVRLVYQYTYKNNKPVTGFGDFIRGCYYLLQFGEKYKVHIEFAIQNHPLQKYLNFFKDKPSGGQIDCCYFDEYNATYTKHQNIINYEYMDIDSTLMYFLNEESTKSNNGKYCVHVFLINHPDIPHITDSQRCQVRELFVPTDLITDKVNQSLDQLQLTKSKFNVIHIRVDDSFFSNDTPSNESLSDIRLFLIDDFIKKYIHQDLLLISNSTLIKKYISQHHPSIKMQMNEIGHICDKQQMNDETKLINTLQDFYIMSHANYIGCFSTYLHGSGFSKWCAITFQIPYTCYYIGNIN